MRIFYDSMIFLYLFIFFHLINLGNSTAIVELQIKQIQLIKTPLGCCSAKEPECGKPSCLLDFRLCFGSLITTQQCYNFNVETSPFRKNFTNEFHSSFLVANLPKQQFTVNLPAISFNNISILLEAQKPKNEIIEIYSNNFANLMPKEITYFTQKNGGNIFEFSLTANCLQGSEEAECQIKSQKKCIPPRSIDHYTCNSDGIQVCKPGWQGVNCDEALCQEKCQNNGKCVAPGECECPKGWRGMNCQECVPILGCSNGGTCSSDSTKCVCQPGWTGKFCQFRLKLTCLKNTCKNGGFCNTTKSNINSNDNKRSLCVCLKGFSGTDCSHKIDACSNNPCGSYGVCIARDSQNFVCNCDKGYYGKFCKEKFLNTKPFSNDKSDILTITTTTTTKSPPTTTTTTTTPPTTTTAPPTTTTIIPSINQQLATHNIFMGLLVIICFIGLLSFCLFHLRKLFKNGGNNQQQQEFSQQQQNMSDCAVNSLSTTINLPPNYTLISPKIFRKNQLEDTIKISPNSVNENNIKTTKIEVENYRVDIPEIEASTTQCNNNRWRSTKSSSINSTDEKQNFDESLNEISELDCTTEASTSSPLQATNQNSLEILKRRVSSPPPPYSISENSSDIKNNNSLEHCSENVTVALKKNSNILTKNSTNQIQRIRHPIPPSITPPISNLWISSKDKNDYSTIV